jgi:hypothetical protein
MRTWLGPLLLLGVIASIAFPGGAALAASPVVPGAHATGGTLAPANGLSTFASTPTTSTNWAGYAATTSTTGAVTKVSASWTEPAVKCGSKTSYAAFWVGIDGFSSSTVEQDGTLAMCSGGVASYYVWWEMYPTNAIQVWSTVSAGDHFTASVRHTSGTHFNLTVTDTTTRTTWTTVQSQSGSTASQTSAECIAEAPSSGSVLPLANFHSMTFTSCRATISGANHPLGSFSSVYAITMTNGGTITKASVGTISSTGTFRVTWHHS